MDPVAQAIDDCRVLTARMLESAEQGDWETVTTLDAQRHVCFDEVDVAALRSDALTTILEEFRALMAMDGRLRDQAAEARHAVLVEVRKVRGRQHGQARYQELAQRG